MNVWWWEGSINRREWDRRKIIHSNVVWDTRIEERRETANAVHNTLGKLAVWNESETVFVSASWERIVRYTGEDELQRNYNKWK
jgi:hypothetical protein